MVAIATSQPARTPAATVTTLPASMRAVCVHRYGGPEQLEQARLSLPEPGPGEVLVRVHASSVNFGDNVILSGRPLAARPVLGFFGPRQPVFGLDCAGEVVALGPGVEAFAVGDRVFGEARGACAEFAIATVDKLALLPENVPFTDGAATPVAGVTALRAMQLADVQPGQSVLINGASGGVGSFAVQVARALGAEVTAVCSGRNAELVRRLGAAHVVDYQTTDLAATTARYDVILDLVGSTPLGACRRLLKAGGTYISSVGRMGWVLKAALIGLVDKRVKTLMAPVGADALATLADMLASGAVQPAIEHRWRLDQVADALHHQRTGRTRGKCVIVVSPR